MLKLTKLITQISSQQVSKKANIKQAVSSFAGYIPSYAYMQVFEV